MTSLANLNAGIEQLGIESSELDKILNKQKSDHKPIVQNKEVILALREYNFLKAAREHAKPAKDLNECQNELLQFAGEYGVRRAVEKELGKLRNKLANKGIKKNCP